MKVYLLRREQRISCARPDVFAFFARPENLAVITPPSLGFRILTPSPIVMTAGAVLDYTVAPLGIPVRWTTLITEYEPPSRFVDVQLRGPYSFWHHTHTFAEDPDGTVMIDEVRYVVPFGFLGRLTHTLVIRRKLDEIFTYRARVLRDLLAAKNAG